MYVLCRETHCICWIGWYIVSSLCLASSLLMGPVVLLCYRATNSLLFFHISFLVVGSWTQVFAHP